jgi:protoheme IX farnesyltransferase
MKAVAVGQAFQPDSGSLAVEAPPLARPRLADYCELTKPRVAVLVLFTVAAGALLAAGGAVEPLLLLHTVLGTALVAAGASALNQWLERHRDAHMRRTASRPLPAGRLLPAEALAFGVVLGIVGVAYLALALPTFWAAGVAAFTFVCYVGVYTPLKPLTTLNTLVGAVPGAMPPVIGYVAVRGAVTAEAVALFLILFLWQVPHFLAIAWMYRDDYARAGYRMLPAVDPDGGRTARRVIAYTLALIVVSLGPLLLGAGFLYGGGALLLGGMFLADGVRFQSRRSTAQARRVLRASLLYLPGLFALLLLDAALRSLLRG